MRWVKAVCMMTCSVAAFAALAAAATPAKADEPGKKEAATRTEAPVFEVVRLKHARAGDAADLLRNVFVPQRVFSRAAPGGRMGPAGPAPIDPEDPVLVADEATNSLLIRAPARKLREILEVVGKLDVEAPDATAARPKVSIFDLRSTEPDGALQNALQVVIGKSPNANFAMDPARKTVIVSADPATTDAVRALLERLEALGTSQGGSDYMVRIVWLLNGLKDGDELSAPPSDLKEMLPGLAKFGFDRPRVAAQIVVNAQLNNNFQAKGIAVNHSVNLSVSGRLRSRTSSPGLDITIQAATNDGERKKVLCNMQTEISAPVGHLVVLGVTPFDHSSSAFVVQVLEKERKQGR